jgi:plasmid stabilization system protein ParE
MRIKVADQAKKKIVHTSKYIRNQFGKEVSEDFKNEIQLIIDLLRENPRIGPVEPLLFEAPVTYRSIVVNRLNKIVYWINEGNIEIVDFWDCRREPKQQAKQV